MAKPAEKLQALTLRRSGASIKEIAKALGVSPGSVSKWVEGMTLTETQRTFLRDRQIASGHRGRLIGAEMNRARKASALRQAAEEATALIPRFTSHDLFFVGLGLYWGEGSKSSNGTLMVANSDPRVMVLMAAWFEKCFGVSKDLLRPRIFISSTHHTREDALIAFWAKALGISTRQFGKTVFLNKGKKVYENHESYYGVLALRVAKGGNIRYKVLAQIERIAQLACRRSSVG